MRTAMVTAVAVVMVGGFVVAQQAGFRRTVVQTVDLSVEGYEAVTAVAELDAGASSGPHTHSGDEVGYVIDGELTVKRDGEDAAVLEAGAGFRIPAGTVHDAVNESDQLVRVLVTYVNPKGEPVTMAAAESAPAAESAAAGGGFFTEEQASRGATSYEERCAACHGADLEGSGFAPGLSDVFMENWVDRSVGELFIRIKETMPADSPASLSDEVYADLTAYLLSANGHPAGDAPLPSDPAALEQFMIPASQ